MSRSNPIDNIPNPCTRWFEWQGGNGNLRYYDKENKTNVEVTVPFDFILLDRLATVKGWHDASEASIYANEVHDTRSEPFIVKSFKMREPIAEGFYSDIKDKVKANGGKFTLNCYMAFTDEKRELALGSIQFHGSALQAWMEFEKENRANIYKSGIQIVESKSGKKGGIKYQTPVFKLLGLPQDVNDAATGLDVQLQEYLRNYFKRTRVEQAEPVNDEEKANREIQASKSQQPDELDQRRDDEGEIPF
jgi:hypothetical protein